MSKHAIFLTTATLGLVLDQITKVYIRATLPLYESIAVIDSLFHITHAENPGGAFSLFADAHASIRRPFFLTVSVIATVALIYMLRQVREDQKLLSFALGAIFGGAIGNFIDRAWFGVVTDFLDVHWHGYYWPAFNVADAFISTGITILLAHSILGDTGDDGAHHHEVTQDGNSR